MKRWLSALVVLVLGRGRRKPRVGGRERIVAPDFPDRRGENWVLLMFAGAVICGIAFPVIYGIEAIPSKTQYLGLSLGLCLMFLAAACALIAKRLVANEEIEHEYPTPHPEEQEDVTRIIDESGDRITRKKLLVAGGVAAGGALGVAMLTPAASLGPALEIASLFRTPWRRGVRLVDETGRVFRADEVEEETFYTAFPQHADREQMGAPIVVVRLKPAELQLPAQRRGWAPDGIVAYSKICTHAGCAIALYRKPTFPAQEPRPALVCPCHYSTFDPGRAGKVLFGPAGRDLPQLPLAINGAGELVAAGNFSGAPGPSWWGVRNRKPTS